MPAKAQKKEFDFDKFRGCLAHFDDGDTPERSNAIRQAFKMCEDFGVRFCDAAAQAYGDDRVADLENAVQEKQSEINALQSELGETNEKGDKLSDLYSAEVETNDKLRAELEDLKEAGGGRETSLIDSPKLRLLLLVVVIAARISLWLAYEDHFAQPPDGERPIANLLFSVVGFWLLITWCRLEYRRDGFAYAAGKITLFFAGLALVFYLFTGWWPWTMNGVISFVMFQPLGSLSLHHPVVALVVLVIVALITLSKFNEKLAGGISGKFSGWSGAGFLRTVRDWF